MSRWKEDICNGLSLLKIFIQKAIWKCRGLSRKTWHWHECSKMVQTIWCLCLLCVIATVEEKADIVKYLLKQIRVIDFLANIIFLCHHYEELGILGSFCLFPKRVGLIKSRKATSPIDQQFEDISGVIWLVIQNQGTNLFTMNMVS